MVKLFISNRSIVQFLLPPVVLTYVLFNNHSNYFVHANLLSFGFWGNLEINSIISQLLAGLLVIINAIGLNAIFNWNQFLERNSFMPSLLYVVLMSFYHSFYDIDGLLVAHTFLILSLYQVYFLRQNEDGRRATFNATFFGGVAATFHPPLIGYLPFYFVMIWTIRPFILREILLSIVGFLVPLLYASFYLYYSGNSLDMSIFKQSTNFQRQQFDFLVTLVIFLLSLILSFLSIQAHIRKSSIRLKKLTRVLWFMVVAGLLMGLIDFISHNQIQRFSLIMIPLSFFLTFSYFHKTLSSLAIGLFYITLSYSVIKFFL
ncbi:MAG: hypothetical protein ACON4M_05775 [Crocinitomicaceae bacterium]